MQHQTTFIIEDEFHAEQQGEFKTFKDAFSELQQRANILLGMKFPIVVLAQIGRTVKETIK